MWIRSRRAFVRALPVRVRTQLRGRVRENWPHPEVGVLPRPMPEMLLLLTPPYSGSTAIASFLNQGRGIVGLRPDFEGQWLVPGLSARGQRWSPDLDVDAESVRLVWAHRLSELERDGGSLRFFVEKSPPNMVRYRLIRDLFVGTRVVCNNRHPLAWISSVGHRVHRFGDLDSRERELATEQLAEDWLSRARSIRTIAQDESYPLVTYEEFCRDPRRIVAAFGLAGNDDEFEFDADHQVAVKDYAPQRIQNMNERQIALLTREDRRTAASVLGEHVDVLEYFGYEDALDTGA